MSELTREGLTRMRGVYASLNRPKLVAAIDMALAYLDAKADAERYRWLRDRRSMIEFDRWPGGYPSEHYFPDDLDAAIDAAMKG